MALGFIKKIFSFGKSEASRPTPDAPAETMEQPSSVEVNYDRDNEPLAAPIEADDAVLDHGDGVFAFTAETSEGHLSTPEPDPQTLEDAGEAISEEEEDFPPQTVSTDLRDGNGGSGQSDLAMGETAMEAPVPTPASPAEQAGPGHTDAVLAFTAETSGAQDISTPEPEAQTEENAGEAASEEEEGVLPQTVANDSDAEEDISARSDLAMGETPMETLVPTPAPEPEPEPVEPDAAAVAAEPALPEGFVAASRKPQVASVEPEEKLTWYQRLRRGLLRTSSQLTGQISALFTKRKLDEDTLQDLEDLLIQADLGVETAMRVTGALSAERYGKDVSGEDVTRIMAAEIAKVLSPVAVPLELDLSHKPHVILVVGVNGTGKTTTIGKLAAKLNKAGLKVMMAAGDTFRAAAIEQLHVWAERTNSQIVSTKLGADAAGLAYEAFEKARAAKSDVLIIDTAGRLQNKTELMAELEKIVRVLGKLDPDAPHTVLQTLDATTGQNALQQVEIFRNIAGVSGLIMTKLDGTARGGILVAISAKHKLPIYFIGVGEGVDDLEPFDAQDFAEAIAGLETRK